MNTDRQREREKEREKEIEGWLDTRSLGLSEHAGLPWRGLGATGGAAVAGRRGSWEPVLMGVMCRGDNGAGVVVMVQVMSG